MSEQPENGSSPTLAYVMTGLVIACWIALLVTGITVVGAALLGVVTVLVGVMLYQRFRS